MLLFKQTIKFILLFVLFSNIVHAEIYPRGCEVSGFGYSNNYVVLNDTGVQAYYLLQNRTNDKIELERQDSPDAFMSPPLHAAFEPMNWGAFASDVKDLYFKCYKRLGENTSLVNCRDVLDICRYPRVKFALSNMGNYWISINKPQDQVIQESVAKGIYLKW